MKIFSSFIRIKEKYKTEFLYLLFGIITTLINTIIFVFLYQVVGYSNVLSNSIAWLIAVIFAFITNRLFVFVQNEKGIRKGIFQFFIFIISRISTGIIDIAIMFLSVSVLNFNSVLMKLFTNVIVIILNYVLSKKYIFNEIVR
jgi:putative flippase GtrA